MSPRRRSIEIDGVAHAAPIPMGARIDNIVYSSAIMGIDPETGSAGATGEEQVRLAFANVARFLVAAGVTPDDVIRMTVLLEDMELREFVNDEWLKMFPDPHNRPARHAVSQHLNGSMLVQLEVIAVASD